ncbi:5-oxoprolinase subunit PxpB [Bradyrhizobium sp. LHD-71]|uniref:5-oxoprolinase subunit PxpB n=1 Tax=Bradyrhizobium sp. LHD-71 TaxID=3072141 RepID=UPI00280F4FEC|nr:5-oxoprolinase subunit PxpB [Bradyrhizobium sp. LHD-71]MDQ8728922.1 5-oxoprolinase subunit PxpB [Bradyrhizobium sp. LHD-71]
MPSPSPRIVPCSEAALVVEFGDTIDEAINRKVLGLDRAIAQAKIAGIIETVPTYRSLLVHYDPLALSFAQLSAQIEPLANTVTTEPGSRRCWRVPVVYGGEYGIDLEEVAKARGLSPEDVIRLHTGGHYYVAMLGFLPSFAYLAGLDPRLASPRRREPRAVTPAGTISIGGVQAGIQCLAAPSGWHLLGRTPVRTYHPGREPVFLIEPGDAVRFYAIDPREWAALDQAAEAGEPVAELVAS